MSWDLAISTSPPRRPRHQTLSLFRLEEPRPFDPGLFGLHANAPRVGAPPPLNRPPIARPPRGGGARARTGVAPSAADAYDGLVMGPPGLYEEQEGLLGHGARDRRSGIDLPSSLTLCAAVFLWVVIIGVVFIMYWQFSASMQAAQEAAAPYFGLAINHTMSILAHVDESTIGAHDMVGQAQSLADQAVPAMDRMLNQTSVMIARLEALAKNPVMQISLTQGLANAGGGG